MIPLTCPLLSVAKHLSERMGVNNDTVLCVENECAWWDKSTGMCAILLIAKKGE